MDMKYYEQYKILGLNIAYHRKRRNYSQLELAALLDIDRSHMSAVEIAYTGVSLDVIFKISEVLQIACRQLFNFQLEEETNE